jgi:cystathionine beta-lyase
MRFDFSHIPDRRKTNSFKWTSYAEDVLPLWVADMDFTAPPAILAALQRIIDHGILGYEFATPRLKATVAARMERLYGWQVDPDWIIPTPGVVTGFNLAAWVTCNPGDGILTQPPVYHPFFDVQKNIGLVQQNALLAPTTRDHILRYEFDFDGLKSAFNSNNARTRLFLLCNPHNPSGRVFTRDELLGIAGLCLGNDTVICSDEIHSELILDDVKHIPIATLSPEIAQRTITLIAPSKTFNVAGLFTAFAIIPDPDLRERYQKQSERLTFHINALGLVAAETAYSGACDEWLADLLRYLKANRDFVTDYVRENFPGVRTTIPEATYLSYLDFRAPLERGLISGSPFEFFLEKGKVALNDGTVFRGGEGFLRLNFGCPRATLIEGLERMKQALG